MKRLLVVVLVLLMCTGCSLSEIDSKFLNGYYLDLNADRLLDEYGGKKTLDSDHAFLFDTKFNGDKALVSCAVDDDKLLYHYTAIVTVENSEEKFIKKIEKTRSLIESIHGIADIDYGIPTLDDLTSDYEYTLEWTKTDYKVQMRCYVDSWAIFVTIG